LSPAPPPPPLSPLSLHDALPISQVLVRHRVVVAGDEAEARFLDARAVAAQERGLDDRREHRALVHESLDPVQDRLALLRVELARDRKSTRLNSSHVAISYAVFCL